MPDFHLLLRNLSDYFVVGMGRKRESALIAFEDGFHGFATFYPSAVLSSFGNPEIWREFGDLLFERNMLFIPTVSPGINETALSVQLTHRARSRANGEYYDWQWTRAIETESNVILINSFNNWIEGTAIEPVSSNVKFPLNDKIWVGTDPQYFVRRTKAWSDRLKLVPT
jgi:hypothetical protein